jgi:hypothetical protein
LGLGLHIIANAIRSATALKTRHTWSSMARDWEYKGYKGGNREERKRVCVNGVEEFSSCCYWKVKGVIKDWDAVI